ncbi:uncharacterized protein VTP21DRAFT_8520 [Calcarisporiella thermophila]|uniref:uncharacterized protein n=1 Tax=Calcarisporiella thermophila TaxID=911321 RepID=UPI00374343E7
MTSHAITDGVLLAHEKRCSRPKVGITQHSGHSARIRRVLLNSPASTRALQYKLGVYLAFARKLKGCISSPSLQSFLFPSEAAQSFPSILPLQLSLQH